MRLVMRLLLALAIALVIVGCVEPEAPLESASMSATTPAPAADAGAANVTGSNVIEPELVTVAISYDGATPTLACVPSGPGSCTGGPLIQGGSNTWYPLEHEGLARSIGITVSWAAATPATEQMSVVIVASAACEEGPCERRRIGEETVGPSPLTLTMGTLGLVEGETIGVHVGNARIEETPAGYLLLGVHQAFSVEGSVVAAIPPDA